MKQLIASSSVPMKVEVEKVKPVVKTPGVKEWSVKIEATGKFKIGTRDTAFTLPARYNYIRRLMDYFTVSPDFAGVTLEQLFDPMNSYGNFQHLLNMCPVPSDFEGFYLNDERKNHLQSQFLTSP